MARVFIALSGGVDSTVAAWDLIQQGHDVSGIYMRHSYQPVLSPADARGLLKSLSAKVRFTVGRFSENGYFFSYPCNEDNQVIVPEDAGLAMRTAADLGIPFYMLDVSSPFESIVDNFVSEFYDGRTPNPCVLCNRTLKFGKLMQAAQSWGGEYFSTGHYVRLGNQEDWLARQENEVPDWLAGQKSSLPLLERADNGKDQSYVLYDLPLSILGRLIFPLSAKTKEEVRQTARSQNLAVADRKDSQDICFIEQGRHLEFLSARSRGRETKGNFVSLDGKVIGQHPGYEHFTIGQRKGLRTGFGERIFVQRIDAKNREVVLGPYEALARTEIQAVDSNWHVELPPECEFRCSVKIRYRTPCRDALVRVEKDGTITARLDSPCYGVAPGQALVCYYGSRILGGGTII